MFPVRDMRLSGQVIHTGRSSMEVAVRMEALEKDGREETIMLGMLSSSFSSPDSYSFVFKVDSSWFAEMRLLIKLLL